MNRKDEGLGSFWRKRHRPRNCEWQKQHNELGRYMKVEGTGSDGTILTITKASSWPYVAIVNLGFPSISAYKTSSFIF